MSDFYLVQRPNFLGAHGAIFSSGLGCRSVRSCRESPILLQRTGPFVPPISFPIPGAVVVTESFREMLEGSEYGGFKYREVIKQHIVELRWEHFDRNGSVPSSLIDEVNEVEDHILGRPHSDYAASAMATLWEIVLEQDAETFSTRGKGRGRSCYSHYIYADTWNGHHFFHPLDSYQKVATSAFASWLNYQAENWVSLTQMTSVSKGQGTEMPQA